MISEEAMEALNKYFPEEVKKIREQGFEQGRKEGRAIVNFTIMRRMKNYGCCIQEILQVTGIRIKGIKKI
ncbi:MAG: hypothetical protein IJ104_04320 [Methanobrevibacter sp.]|nr:hypothetical protein [Methanobrevibacter sp.]